MRRVIQSDSEEYSPGLAINPVLVPQFVDLVQNQLFGPLALEVLDITTSVVAAQLAYSVFHHSSLATVQILLEHVLPLL